MKKMRMLSTSPFQTQKIARKLAKKCLSQGSIIALNGPLGAGKTTFAQGFALGLGITQRILSPTFMLIRQLNIPNSTKSFYHLDLYRLEEKSSFKQLGLNEIFESDNIILIEWAQKLQENLPKKAILVNLKIIDETKREIEIIKQLEQN